ncbi:Uncharacterised protein [uncultured archaeon]|nr:Uncharacterised protein [uncultured archaeon]
MNSKVKLAISGLILAVLVLSIINFQLHAPQQREIIKPPPATLMIDGKEQVSGVGSYCWNGVFSSVCADYAGIPTVSEPLPANSTFTAHLVLPLKEPPQELQLKVAQVTNKDMLEPGAGDIRLWRSGEGKYLTLPLESEQDVNLSLEPGLYVLEVFPGWKEKGSVSYGFLIKVE